MHQKLVSRWELESAWCRWKAMAVKSCINLWSSKEDLAELFKQYYLLFLQMSAGLLHQYYFKSSYPAPATCFCPHSVCLSSLRVWHTSDLVWPKGKKTKGAVVGWWWWWRGSAVSRKGTFSDDISFWRFLTMHTRWFSHLYACPMKMGRDVWRQGEKEMVIFWNLSQFQVSCPYNTKLSP